MKLNTSVLQLLKCPICSASLEKTEDGKSCRCCGSRAHCFDFSRSGYLHLGGSRAGDGDGKDAVRARKAFLEAGYYQHLSDTVNQLLNEPGASTVLDAGCGEGYYTNRMAENRDVLGVDLSKDGIDLAAKTAKANGTTAGFAVASLFEMPVKDACIDVVTNLFAPCAEDEFARVLKPNGMLLLVGAGERHLIGLKDVLYDHPYLNPGRNDLPKHMTPIKTMRLHENIRVEGNSLINALFSMTPYYWRTSERDRAKLSECEVLETEIDFDIYLFRKGQ